MTDAIPTSGRTGPGPGHNGGPSLERGHSWRRHAWTASRAQLMPRLPLEVLRRRLRRAQEVGLDYSTYASFRASGGDDIVAILFSSNALHLLRREDVLPQERASRLVALRQCGRGALAVQPMTPDAIGHALSSAGAPPDLAAAAPGFLDNWPDIRERVQGALRQVKWPASRVLLVGDTALERGWTAAGGLGGYVPAERYFG